MDTRKLSVKEISAKCLIEFQPTESTQGAGLLQGFLSHQLPVLRKTAPGGVFLGEVGPTPTRPPPPTQHSAVEEAKLWRPESSLNQTSLREENCF